MPNAKVIILSVLTVIVLAATALGFSFYSNFTSWSDRCETAGGTVHSRQHGQVKVCLSETGKVISRKG